MHNFNRTKKLWNHYFSAIIWLLLISDKSQILYRTKKTKNTNCAHWCFSVQRMVLFDSLTGDVWKALFSCRVWGFLALALLTLSFWCWPFVLLVFLVCGFFFTSSCFLSPKSSFHVLVLVSVVLGFLDFIKCYQLDLCLFVCLFLVFVCLGGFKGSVRWPKGHLIWPWPSLLAFFYFCFLFLYVLLFCFGFVIVIFLTGFKVSGEAARRATSLGPKPSLFFVFCFRGNQKLVFPWKKGHYCSFLFCLTSLLHSLFLCLSLLGFLSFFIAFGFSFLLSFFLLMVLFSVFFVGFASFLCSFLCLSFFLCFLVVFLCYFALLFVRYCFLVCWKNANITWKSIGK